MLTHTACLSLPTVIFECKALKYLLCLQATAAGEAFVHKVVHTLRPKPEPVEDAARAGSLQTKIQAAPASTPPPAPTQAASAVQKQVQCMLLKLSSRCVSTFCQVYMGPSVIPVSLRPEAVSPA